MTNREHYKDQILNMGCVERRFSGPFIAAFNKWLDEEYVEPCPFEKGELVEVSDDRTNWCLRYFSHINDTNIKYTVYVEGLKESKDTSRWLYCRKYGSLGGLVKEENKIKIDVAKKIWDIARISPDYGNAVMDVIGHNAYCEIAKLVGSCENKEGEQNNAGG